MNPKVLFTLWTMDENSEDILAPVKHVRFIEHQILKLGDEVPLLFPLL